MSASASMSREEICAKIVNAANEFAAVKPETMTLLSHEGIKFEVPLALAEQAEQVKTMVADGLTSVPLPNISAPMAERMISFWTEHQGSDKFTQQRQEEVRNWEKTFFDKMSRDELLEFAIAANYMESKEMLVCTCTHIAGVIKDMTVEDARDFFGIENDYTPEEEQRLREENKWAFEETKTN